MLDRTPVSNTIQTKPRSHCHLCGSKGTSIHQEVADLVFGIDGKWNFNVCTNPKCRLVWLDPAPLETEIHKAYQTYYTHGHETVPPSALYQKVRNGYLQVKFGYTQDVGILSDRFYAPLAYIYPTGPMEIAANVMFLSAPHAESRLLDIGCGDGQFLERMQDLGWTVEGLDFDSAAVTTARSRGLNVHYGDLTEQHYVANSFDVITMQHVIEHIYNPIQLLREARRVLKPKGTLVLITPNASSWGHSHFKQDWRGLEPPRHLHIFSPQNIHFAMQDAGFTSIEIFTVARGARYILSMSRAIKMTRLGNGNPVGFSGPERQLSAMLYQYWARVLHTIRRQSGEEIVVIAHQ